MLSPGFFYLLLSVVLFTVGVLAHFHSADLSLPISPVITVLTAILPILAFLNAFVYPSLLRTSYAPTASRLLALLPNALQTLQCVATSALGTMLLQRMIPSTMLSCLLENDWSRLFRTHDGQSIRRIQDTLNCCGFNSVRDRAYPFGQPSQCSEVFGRDVPCAGVYRGAMQLNSGLDFMVVACVGLMQIFGLFAMREGTNWWTAWRTRAWAPDMVQPESGRPLLAAPDGDEEAAEAAEDGIPSRRYGGTDDSRPRVEPSPMHGSEPNAWNEQ